MGTSRSICQICGEDADSGGICVGKRNTGETAYSLYRQTQVCKNCIPKVQEKLDTTIDVALDDLRRGGDEEEVLV